MIVDCICLLLLYHIAACLSIGLICKVYINLGTLSEDGQGDSILLYHCKDELSIGLLCKIFIKLGVLAHLRDSVSVPLYYFFAALSMGLIVKCVLSCTYCIERIKKQGFRPAVFTASCKCSPIRILQSSFVPARCP